MKKIYYETNTSGNYARLNAIKRGLIETGRFTLVSEDSDSAPDGSTETSKKVVLKYQGISENIVITEIPNVYHCFKMQSGQNFIKSGYYVDSRKLCQVAMFQNGFFMVYGSADGCIVGVFETDGKREIFTFDEKGTSAKISVNGGAEKSFELNKIKASGVEGDKVGYTSLLYTIRNEANEPVLQKKHFPKLYQAFGTPKLNNTSVVAFESGRRFFALPGSEKLMISLDGELA